MPVTPDEFNTQSERTKRNFDDEIALRCAISRKYYNVFHFVRENADSHPSVEFQEQGDHTRVVNFIDDIGRSNLSDDVAWLKRKREEADYDLDEEFDEMDYEMFNREFQSVMSNLRPLSATW